VRVPAYSPYAVAEHAAALLMTLTRHIHRAAVRTKDFNFSLAGLTGFDLHGKTAGVVGTGKIGRIFADICKGFGMRVLAYDAFPNPATGLEYVTLDRLLAESDIVSLHCPLLPETKHLINADTLAKAKRGFTLINTSRGGLVDSEALLSALRDGTVGAAGLDVYEEESEWFYEDRSDVTRQNKTLSLLVSRRGKICSPSDISSALGGEGYETSGNTLAKLLSRLKARLGAGGNLIVNERGHGYMLV
jgi:D-lactate dehydrogenase